MSWKVVQASVIGTSHGGNGEACQDDCAVAMFPAPCGEECLVALVSDGAGSAICGGMGAMVACESGIRVIEQWVIEAQSLSDLSSDIVVSWVDTIHYQIWLASKAAGYTPRDYACTLLGAVIGEKNAAFFQVGDGAIVIDDGDGFRPVFWPDSGEYANMTYFVTDEDMLSHLHSEVSFAAPLEVALFSDGIQRLALAYESRTVHKPFFEPMFARLRQTGNDECDVLSEQLASFLGSARVNERSDDDKTLVLATRRL